MDSKKILEETIKLKNEAKELQKRIYDINTRYLEIANFCPHEIVFKFYDDRPRKKLIDGNYFCPACGKMLQIIDKEHLKRTPFCNSRVIPLNDIYLREYSDELLLVRDEVFNNADIYYNKEITCDELSEKMENALKDKNDSVLRRIEF